MWKEEASGWKRDRENTWWNRVWVMSDLYLNQQNQQAWTREGLCLLREVWTCADEQVLQEGTAHPRGHVCHTKSYSLTQRAVESSLKTVKEDLTSMSRVWGIAPGVWCSHCETRVSSNTYNCATCPPGGGVFSILPRISSSWSAATQRCFVCTSLVPGRSELLVFFTDAITMGNLQHNDFGLFSFLWSWPERIYSQLISAFSKLSSPNFPPKWIGWKNKILYNTKEEFLQE